MASLSITELGVKILREFIIGEWSYSKILFKGLISTTKSIIFNTLGISKTSVITNSQYVDGKKLGGLTNKNMKQNIVRMEQRAEFNGLEVIQDKCTLFFRF